VILLTQGEKCKVMFFCPPWQMKCLMNWNVYILIQIIS
jgi:hypothetical protein